MEVEGEQLEDETRVLEIPIKNTEDMIDVPVDSLPDDVVQIIDVLRAEEAELWRWIQFAVEYYRQGRLEQFEQILREGCSGEVDLRYTDDTQGRIAMLNAYAAFKISQGKAEWLTNRATGEQLLTDAVEFLNRADRINNMADSTWVNKGVLNMVRGQDLNALRDFSNALEINSKNLIGILGKASVLFQMKQFREARDHYMRAIRTHPGCDASVRFGLGLCFYELKQPSRAVECFERTLQLDPNNVDALVALSVLELNKATQQVKGGPTSNGEDVAHNLVLTAMQRLQKAYQLNPTSPMVLNHLANHFFLKDDKDYARIDSLARTAYHTSENSKVRAEACYILARNGHDQGYLEVAQKFYDNALASWPEFSLAKFGKVKLMQALAPGQEKASPAEVIKSLEELMKDKEMAKQADLKYLLGAMYAREDTPERARDATRLLTEVTEELPDSVEAWVEYAQHKQKSDVKSDLNEALRAYRRAMKVIRRSNKPIPSEIWCNIGVLLYKSGDYQEAMTSFMNALVAEHVAHSKDEDSGNAERHSELVSEVADSEDKALEYLDKYTITILYNIALTWECQGRIVEAEKFHHAIKDKFPFYTDCYLRLGALAEQRGMLSVAADWYQEAINRDSANADGWSLLGNLEMAKGDRRAAKAKFDKLVRQKNMKHDAYARLAMGNVALASAMGKPNGPEVDKGLREALGIFRAVLSLNNKNVFAANGIGVVLAMRGLKNPAQKIFDKVREVADTKTPAVWINMAHLAMSEEKYEVAASMYEQCLRRFYAEQEPELLNYLANARYGQGRFEDARDVLVRALREAPDNLKLWFNLAVVEESYGAKVLNIKPNDRTLKQVQDAMASLKRSYATFVWLAAMEAKKPASKTAEDEELPHIPASPPGSPSGVKHRPAASLMPLLLDLAKDHKERNYANLPLVDTSLNNSAMRSVDDRTGGAVFKRASKAKEHAEWVGSTIKKAAKHVEKQRKLERQKEIERHKFLEVSRAAEASREEKLARERKEKEEEEKKNMERALELEKQNFELVQKYLEEEQFQKQAAQEKALRTKTRKKRIPKMAQESESSGDSSSSDDEGPRYRRPNESSGSDSSSDDEGGGGKRSLAQKRDPTPKKRKLAGGELSSSSEEDEPPKSAGVAAATVRKGKMVMEDSEDDE